MSSALEQALAFQLRAVKSPPPIREHRFHPTRRWRFDFAWPDRLPPVACEVEGGTWIEGAHTRGKHFESDCEKYAEAALLGWCVVRVTSNMIHDGRALRLLERALS